MSFPYDIELLIQLVEARPCIWDKSSDDYKDKVMKMMAWNEIFKHFEERFEEMSPKERKDIGGKIMCKWINLKDAFLKSVKKKSAKSTTREYLYAGYLQFLLNNYNQTMDERVDSMDDYECSSDPLSVVPDYPVSLRQNTQNDCISIEYASNEEEFQPKPKKFKNVEMVSIKDSQISSLVQELNERSEDSLKKYEFFTSFLPYLVDMDESEKLELHMDILNSIKRIKQNRISIKFQ